MVEPALTNAGRHHHTYTLLSAVVGCGHNINSHGSLIALYHISLAQRVLTVLAVRRMP